MRRVLAILAVFTQVTVVAARAEDRGALTVTATVVTSVAIVMDQSGNPRVVVANPADRNDNVSYVSYASRVTAENPKKSEAGKVQPAAKRKAATLR